MTDMIHEVKQAAALLDFANEHGWDAKAEELIVPFTVRYDDGSERVQDVPAVLVSGARDGCEFVAGWCLNPVSGRWRRGEDPRLALARDPETTQERLEDVYGVFAGDQWTVDSVAILRRVLKDDDVNALLTGWREAAA